jgi:hypothetical protein
VIARARLSVVVALALVAVAVAAGTLVSRLHLFGNEEEKVAAASGARLPAFDPAAGWLNGGPLIADSLRGHPVVVVLWSDTDPRCVNALPEVESWHQAFARYGVRVVGLYEPDYSFGADPAVPALAARRLDLSFPIALDPGYRIPLATGRGRPVIVVADTSGRIVLTADGDRLAAVDRAIREQVRRLHPEIAFPAGPGPAAADGPGRRAATRFAFLGTARASNGPIAGAQPGRTLTFTTQFRFQEEGSVYVAYPVGRWTPSAEGLAAARGGAMNYVAVRHEGGRVSVVMSPPGSGPARVWILQDDNWLPADARDEDVRVDARGASYIDVTEPRLYWIARGRGGHVIKLSPEDAGVTLYAFAFEPADSGSERAEPGGAEEPGTRARH